MSTTTSTPDVQSPSTLPIIDLSPLAEKNDDADKRIARQIDQAFRETGFCYLTGFDIDQKLVDNAFASALRFFRSDRELKQEASWKKNPATKMGWTGSEVTTPAMRYSGDDGRTEVYTTAADFKEFYQYAYDPTKAPGAKGDAQSPNVWPESMPELERDIYAYFQAMSAIGDEVMRLVAVGLDLPQDFFATRFKSPSSLGGLNYYPSLPKELVEKGSVSLAEHSDWTVVSLLLQDSVGGLEVQKRGSDEWIKVTPIPGTIVINVGDLLARWSNDRYVSTPHRVVNLSTSERITIPVFCIPDGDVVIDPRDLIGADEVPSYGPITTRDYLNYRLEELHSLEES